MPTQLDNDVLPEFESIRDPDETILWTGKPEFRPYIFGSIFLPLLLLLFFGYYLFSLISDPYFSIESNGFLWWGTVSLALIFALSIISSFLTFGNTLYGYSNKRIIIRTGFAGTDFKVIDYDKIMSSEVNVSMLERMYNVGTIKFSTGKTTSKNRPIYDRFYCIENPYEVFKLIKKITVDIKTDYNYPNAKRPENNPGYNTKYKPMD